MDRKIDSSEVKEEVPEKQLDDKNSSVHSPDGQSVEPPPKLRNNYVLVWYKLACAIGMLLWEVYECKVKPMKREGTNRANNKRILPYSTKDVANSSDSVQRDVHWKAFPGFILQRVYDTPPRHRLPLLIVCLAFLASQVKNLDTPFDFQYGNSPPHSPLPSVAKAFLVFLPEMIHMTMFMLSYLAVAVLVMSLHVVELAVQVFLMILLISAPLYYFSDLARKASGHHVDCASFKLPLIWFAILGALCFSLIFGLMILLLLYYNWRYIQRGPSKEEEEEEEGVNLDDIAGIVVGN